MREKLAVAVDPDSHTMGQHLSRYVLPKVPVLDLDGVKAVRVYGCRSLALLLSTKPRTTKLFNWRRPDFLRVGSEIHCVTSPSRDYVHHYGKLIATALRLRGREVPVLTQRPDGFEVDHFIDTWLPDSVPAADVVILGYVHAIFQDVAEPLSWERAYGFGWKHIVIENRSVLLLGCEFSYWGDLAGALVVAIARRKLASWVIYVGKLGSLVPNILPNQALVTGTHTELHGQTIHWQGALAAAINGGADVVCDVGHACVPSVLDETVEWLAQIDDSLQVVDPEIGHMASRAVASGLTFDYLHLVTDNLVADYGEGLYDERGTPVVVQRAKLLAQASYLLRTAILEA